MTASLPGISRGAKRAVAVLFILTLAVGGASLFFTAAEVGKLRAAVLASCAFAADVGSAPVAAGPDGKASELGVALVADSRTQWRKLGCPGRLPPPQPSFAHWARYYRLPAG